MKRVTAFLLLLAGLCCFATDRTGLLKDGAYLKKIRKDHPRLFFNKEMIPAIRATAKARPADFNDLKRIVDRLPDDAPYIELTDRFVRNPDGTIKPKKAGGIQGFSLLKYAGGYESARCALMYLITQDKKYQKKAFNYLKLYVKALQFSEKGDWWMDLLGQTRINAMLAYDIIYNDLTPEERKEVILPLLDYVKKAQPGSVFKFRRTIGGHSNGNYGERALEYFLGIVLYGDGIADKDAETMLKRGAALFVKTMDFRDDMSAGSGLLSTLTTGYAFGAYPLATQLFLLSWKSAFGENIAERWNQMLYYHRFVEGLAFCPDKDGKAFLHGIGDMWHTTNQARLDTGIYTHLAWNIHFYGAKNPEIADEIYYYLGNIPEKYRRISSYLYPMFPFLLTDFNPENVGKGKANTQPYFYAPKFGFLSMWSGRGPEDTYASFRFGSSNGNHQHYDELSFVIFKHDFLALDSGSRTEMDHHHNFTSQSVAHNTILIHMDKEPMAPFWKAWSYKPDGKTYYNHGGQNANTLAKAIALENTADYLYAAGDATASYSNKKCKEAVRQFVYIRPDIFVIYDRVASVKPDQKKEFILHTQNKPESIGQDMWKADLGKGRLFVQTLLPANAGSTLVGGPGKEFFASGRNWPLEPDMNFKYAGNWRLEVTPAAAGTETRFLHVLQAADTGVAAPAKATLRQEGDEDIVTVAGRELRFKRTGKVGFRMAK